MDYKTYGVYDSLNLGDSLKLSSSITCEDAVEMMKFADLSSEALSAALDESTKSEKEIVEKLKGYFKEWDAQAAKTRTIMNAKEYNNARIDSHTSNEWVDTESCATISRHRSNTVYAMYISLYENTKYNRATQQMEPVDYHVSWSVGFNVHASGWKIDGQDRKKFKTRPEAEKYLAGRITKYDNLFTEINPPVPTESKKLFSVHGQLIRGQHL